jgi:iron(III) transport system substrate-binding protein
MFRLITLATVLIASTLFAQEVRLYTSIDEPVAAKVIRVFEKNTGIHVVMTTDTESTKTTGMVERLRAEKANPRCDVWWNNEIFHTIRLANEGLLQPYASPVAKDIPAKFVDAQHRWTAAGVRIRVIMVNNKTAEKISGIQDMLDPALKNKIALAKPSFGTAGGQVAAWYLALGEEKYLQYLRGLKANGVKLLGGNSVVADYVQDAQMLAGFTDNDDAMGAIEHGSNIRMVIPDQQEGAIGTLAAPCTVAMVAGSRNPDAAHKLIDFLISAEAEKMVLDEKYAYASVRAMPASLKLMDATFADVAAAMLKAVNLAVRELE